MTNERNDNASNRWMMPTMNGPESHDGRPKSSCEVPRVPGIKLVYITHVESTGCGKKNGHKDTLILLK